MKILNNLLFLLILSFSFCMGQKDSLSLKLVYFPNKTYTQTVIGTQLIEIQSPIILEPIIKQMNLNSQYIITTDAPVNNIFPITYKILDESNPKFNNLTFIGTCKLGEHPKINFISNNNFNTNEEKRIIDAFDKIIKQIPIINKKLKINDSFTVDFPMVIPHEDINLEVNILMHYTLKEIKGNNAYLDYVMQFTSNNMNIKEINLTMEGEGKGKVIYDIDEHFFTQIQTDNSLEIIGENTDDSFFNIKIKSNISQNISIENNFITPKIE